MSQALPPQAWPQGWRLIAHDILPSTQDAAIQAAHAGVPGRLGILARQQTSGRGRRGRTWISLAGNLNFSALLRPARKPHQHATWPLLAGLALYDAISASLTSSENLMLKWPNDLLLNGAKLAGILMDSGLAPDGTLDWVVIGIGVNIATAPSIDGRRITCLHAVRTEITPEKLAASIAHALENWVRAEPEDICAAWLTHAHPLGTELTISTEAGAVDGAFAGLAPNGGLLLAGHPTEFNVGELDIAQPAPCCSS